MPEDEDLSFNTDPDLPGRDMLEARLDSISVTNVGFILFLKVNDDARVLPIFIGANEAQSIALALNEEPSPRPLTHDLMKAMLESLETSLQRVEIQDIREGTFYGRVFLERAGFEELDFDARPSDAIALALRWEAPIFVSRKVFEEASVPVTSAQGGSEDSEPAEAHEGTIEVGFKALDEAQDPPDESPDAEVVGSPEMTEAAGSTTPPTTPLEERPLSAAEQLHRDLEKAILAEHYEEAARLRDAIKRLSKGN